MKKIHNFLRTTTTVIGVMAILLSGIQPPRALAQGTDDGIERDYNAETGKVSHITVTPNATLSVMRSMSSDMTSIERSDVLVDRFAPEFGLSEPSEELIVKDASKPEADRVVTKYQQVFQGVPVLGGELIVNASEDGALLSMNGEVAQGLSLDTVPSLSAETAIAIAKQGMVKWYGGEAEDYQFADVTLWIFDESLLRTSNRPPELVWRMDMTPADQLQPIRELVLVNAQTGNISLHFNQVDTGGRTESIHNSSITTIPSQIQSNVVGNPLLQSATTWYVATTGNDSNSCSAPASPCATINGAIGKATNGDTIQVAIGTYTGGSTEVVWINRNVSLLGGWDPAFSSQTGYSTIDAQNIRRGISVGATASLDRFIITNGNIIGDGGGIHSSGNVPLTITNSSINNNSASDGGGVYYSGSLIIENSSIYGNEASNLGGGIVVNLGGNLYLDNSTVAENTSNSNGAGMFIYGSATIRNSTIVHNTATNVGGGGISGIFGTSIILENSIVAQNTAPIYPDCNGSFITSQGNNIIGAAVGTCWITPASGDLLATNPIIGFNLIGTVPYYPLLEGSPAINAGNVNTCLVTDQRGVDRLGDASCDIGAYEFTLPGTVNTLFVLSGSGQSIPHDVPFPKSLYVVALDSQGTPVDGAIVSFTAPASGTSAIFPKTGTNATTAITNAEGIASSSIIRANNQSGSYNVLGSSSGVPGSVSFALTNTSGGKYVTTSGNDANSCTSPASPCLTINAAITKATAGEAIYIASGIYSSNVQDPMFTVDKNLTFSGNWNATFTSQNGNTVIDGQNSRGLFKINAGINANIYSLTLQNGYANQGAGIYNQGNLTLKNIAIANNRTYNDGAGIYQHSGQLDIENVTISNNTAKSSGGGIYVYDGTITINSSTITQNFAAEPNGLAIGGGLSNPLNKLVTIKNTIIAGNSADTIPDCRGQFTSFGYNLIGFADGCTLTPAPGDQIGTNSPINAILGNLADNGGGTLTHALLTGSPAIDAGNLATCAATDQRGVSRPQGTTCDIGAYEGSASQTISAVVRTYSANNSNALPGNLLCDQTDPTCTENANPNADRAHQYALGTYQLYLNEHNRNGIDQNNMPIISTVDYCFSSCPYQNAFWTGGQVVYGSVMPLADDIVAHELTHGVTQYESNLFYFYQSGAINESFSDLWGEYYDQANGSGNDAANVKWLHGEDATGVGPYRSMSNPPQYSDPDMMTSALYNKKAPYEDFWDNGGVHSNSGVNNKAVFLMVDGGTFNGKTVTALGWDKVIAIYYEAQTNLLSSGSDYSDLYYAAQQACTNLTGQHGITTADCLEVKDALDAVQMNSQPVAAFNPDAPLCSTGMVTGPALHMFQDDMESGTGNWATNASWTLETGFASSNIHSLFGDDIYVDNLGENMIANPVVLPAGAFLHFKHAFGFEHYPGQNWDGGVLEYTKNGGTTWLDAAPLFLDGQNYKGVIYNHPLSSNVLKGRNAFVGDSHGYVSSRYNLSSLAGQTVQFRWRFATDQSFSYLGWYLDDVRIYTCTGAPATPIPTVPAINALVTDYTPLLDWPDAASTHHYEVQIATDAAFASLLYNDTNVLTSQYQVPLDLAPDTTFYWRVRSVNGVGTLSNWSANSYFRTALLPPVLVSPVQNEHILHYRPTFNWDDVPNATGYTIQISTTNTFAAPIVGNPMLSTFTPATDLPKGLLYWRVQTKGTNGPSAWSEVRSYNGLNPPPAPVLTVPALNALVTDYTPTFTWNNLVMPANTTLLKYQIQADDDPAFASLAFEADSVLNNHTPAVDLPANTKFYWRVRAVNTLDEIGNWSIVSHFRTAITPPVLVTPADLFDATDLRTPFNWDDVPGATGYTLQVSTVNTFASFALNVTTVPSNYTPVANLPAGVPLYWRVIANGLNGPSAPSAYRTITSTNPPSVPLLSLPALNALTTDYTPTLKWTIVTLPLGTSFGRYQVQVDDDPAFASPEVDDSSLTSAASIQLDSPASLAPNTKFYWRVRAFNSVDETNGWSIVSHFRTAITPPVLSLPVNATAVSTLSPIFDWSDVPTATGYTIQASTSSTFATTLVNATTVSSTYTPLTALPSGYVIFWRVRTNGLNGPSDWTTTILFTTP